MVGPAQYAEQPIRKNSSSSVTAAMHHTIRTASVSAIESLMEIGSAWNARTREHTQELLVPPKTKLASHLYQDEELPELKLVSVAVASA